MRGSRAEILDANQVRAATAAGKITVDVRSEILELKITINTMVDLL